MLARQAYRAVLVSNVDLIDDAIASAAQWLVRVVVEVFVMPFRFFEVFGASVCVFSAIDDWESAKSLDKQT